MRNIFTIILFTVLFIAVAGTVSAESKLEIDRVEIVSDGRTLLTTSSSSSSLKIDPGEELKISIRLENNYADSSNNDIDDVKVIARIDDIDDGDDISDSERVDVLADSHKTVKLRLKIPKDASSYKSYDLVVTAVGEDQNSTELSDKVIVELDVKRKENEIVFETLQISDADCNGDATFRIELQNTGEEEEQDVELKVLSNSVGSLYSDTFDLYSINDEDEDSIYSKTATLDLEDLSPGTYTLKVQVVYDNGRKSTDRAIDISVPDCGANAAVTQSTTQQKPESSTERYSNPNRDARFLFGEEQDVVVVDAPPPTIVTPSLPAGTPKQDDGFSVVVLVLANIAIIVFIILLLISWYNR
jgi:uncharacterized membrane protein